MIVHSGSAKRRSTSGFLAIFRLQLRLIVPSAVVFAALLLVVDLGGRFQPHLKSLEAGDRGAIQLALIFLCTLFLSFVSVERESFPLLLSWPLKSGLTVFAKLLAVTVLSSLLLAFGGLFVDFRTFLGPEAVTAIDVGGFLGIILYIAILGQGICLAERSLLPRILALLGWVFSAILICFLAVFPDVGDLGVVLSSLSVLAVALVSLSYAERLAIGRLRRWQVHGSALLLLSILPGLYLFNIYGTRIPGPLSPPNQSSYAFPRFEFRYRLNPHSGSPERFGFRQPRKNRFKLNLLQEGWLFANNRSPAMADNEISSFLKNVETGAMVELPPGSDDLVRIDGELWILRLERQGIDRSRLLLSPLRDLRMVREIVFNEPLPSYDIYSTYINRIRPDLEIFNSKSVVFMFDPNKNYQAASKIPMGLYSIGSCPRLVACNISGSARRRLYDVITAEMLPIEMDAMTAVGCDGEILGLVHRKNRLATGIEIYPFADRVDQAHRRWIEIEPSISLGTSNGVPYIFRHQVIVSAFAPEVPVLQLDPSFGQPERLAQIPGTEFSLLTFKTERTLLLDPTMSNFWVLNYNVPLWPQQAFLSMEQATLILLDDWGDSVRCSLATGECKSQLAKDLPITWIDID